MIGMLAVLIECIVGIMMGAMAGYYGGRIDNILMRITEAMLIIPEIFLLIVMAKFFGGEFPEIKIVSPVDRSEPRGFTLGLIKEVMPGLGLAAA